MAKKTRASTADHEELKIARRKRNRLRRETIAATKSSIKNASADVWPIFAAMPEGQFRKDSNIESRDEAIIYKLAHPKFDLAAGMQAYDNKRRNHGLTEDQRAARIREIGAKAKSEMEKVFSPSEDLVSNKERISPEVRRYLSALRGRDIDTLFEDFRRQFHAQDTINPAKMHIEETLLYKRWRHWSVDDTAPGLRAMDALVHFLQEQEKYFPEDYCHLIERFNADTFISRLSWEGRDKNIIVAACIMAAEYDHSTESFKVADADARGVADLYERHSDLRREIKRRRK
ncbi:hypothetical protein K7A42_21960 [Agrobacterium sp. InxBP2]|uniref:hypothetical protein n=1 Tax=Agrobacterium sp. InxBP2 TaxID=2870329 RepID=UPI00249DBB06|nr:hypothetical protein [Agrobacterium sp. InxBP2]MCW8283569.1 hypothetical protein [Agrobacterium sp. InxBP2]